MLLTDGSGLELLVRTQPISFIMAKLSDDVLGRERALGLIRYYLGWALESTCETLSRRKHSPETSVYAKRFLLALSEQRLTNESPYGKETWVRKAEWEAEWEAAQRRSRRMCWATAGRCFGKDAVRLH